MTIYIVTGENQKFYGAFKTQKHILKHFDLTKNELKSILKTPPHDLNIRCGNSYGNTMLIREQTIY